MDIMKFMEEIFEAGDKFLDQLLEIVKGLPEEEQFSLIVAILSSMQDETCEKYGKDPKEVQKAIASGYEF